MFVQSNPLAIVSMVMLTAVFCYECRVILVDGLRRLLDTLYYAIPGVLFLLLMVGFGSLISWLGWRWLIIGMARMVGAGFLLTALYVAWIELLPFVQKLSRRWTR